MVGNTACSAPIIFNLDDDGKVEDITLTKYSRGKYVIKDEGSEEPTERARRSVGTSGIDDGESIAE